MYSKLLKFCVLCTLSESIWKKIHERQVMSCRGVSYQVRDPRGKSCVSLVDTIQDQNRWWNCVRFYCNDHKRQKCIHKAKHKKELLFTSFFFSSMVLLAPSCFVVPCFAWHKSRIRHTSVYPHTHV